MSKRICRRLGLAEVGGVDLDDLDDAAALPHGELEQGQVEGVGARDLAALGAGVGGQSRQDLALGGAVAQRSSSRQVRLRSP